MKKLEWSKGLLNGGKTKPLSEWKVWCKKNGWRLPRIQEVIDEINRDIGGSVWKTLKKSEYYVFTSDEVYCSYGSERVVCLGVGNVGRFSLNADEGARSSTRGPALGVKMVRK